MRYIIVSKKQIMAVLGVFAALTIAVVGSVRVFAAGNKRLPIYCVETEKKQIAISFDAAWGNTKKVQTFRLL